MSEQWEVRAFGAFGITRDGESLDIRAGLASGLLARLALTPGEPVATEQLVEDLWVDPPANAAGSLRVLVSKLRSGTIGPVLRGGRGGYALDVDADDVDVLRFTRLAVDDDEDGNADVHEAALQAWTGTPFEGLSSFPFAQDAQADLRRQYAAVVEQLAAVRLRSGRAVAAIEVLEPVVAQAPSRESTVKLLAQAYSTSGRMSDALAVIDRLRDVLVEEQGLDPSPSVLAMRQAILRQDDSMTGAGSPSATVRHNIPVPLTRLVGRGQDLIRIEEARATNRLVTLVGPGGAGKTRLAVESARRSTQSIDAEQWMVDLASIPEGGDVLAATADAVGASSQTMEAIAARIEGRPTLIILDNAEHVLSATRGFVSRLLASCGGLAVLVTSREPLAIAGEFVLRVRGLAGEQMGEAVELFRERSTAARGGLALSTKEDATIRQMCRMLDGLPLALELAAARTDMMSIAELSAGLARGDILPSGTSDGARHASLENTIRWSTDSLPADEFKLLVELSGFAGPFTLEAVEKICSPADRPLRDVALSLARKSLVAVDETEDGQRRYRLLESMKAFVRPMVQPDDAARWALAHRDYFASLVDALAPAVHTHEAASAHILFDTLAPDLQLATERSIEAEDRNMALRLACGQSWHWFKRGWLVEGRAILDRALAIAQASDPAVEACALVGGVNLAYQSGDAEAAFEYVRLGIERAKEGDDRLALARLLAYAAYGRSLFGEVEEAEHLINEAMMLSEEAPEWLRAELLMSKGQTLRALSKPSLALDALAEAQRLAQRSGNAWALSSSQYVAGKILIEVKRPGQAIVLLASGAQTAARGGDYPGALALLHLLGGATALVEKHEQGAAVFGAVDAIGRRYSYNPVDAEGDDARIHRERVASGLRPSAYDEAYARGAQLSLPELLELSSSLARSLRGRHGRERRGEFAAH